MSRWNRTFAILVAFVAPAAFALGEKDFIADTRAPGAALIADGETLATLVTDSGEDPGVVRAAADLQADIERVTGKRPAHLRGAKAIGPHAIVIGTLGKSGFIDSLAQSGAIDVAAIRGAWEGYAIQVIEAPWQPHGPIVVVAGSDRRGTIFGTYALSEQIGVSPWYWWADVPPAQRKVLYAPAGTRVIEKPVVRYRGIFLNDEQPALSGWAREKFGGFNHKFYARVFELVLRLRGNFLWPAMWFPAAFYDDDPENGRLADEYGIVIGTSHHEPLMRAHHEWHRGGDKGPWNYEKNGERLREFWRGGVRRTRGYEKVLTLGMRGDGDEPMTADANVALLERIVADQRRIVTEELGPHERNPQVWALYKEVQEYYERGMRVPDDVMLLWCDDNYGNIRRLPAASERKRAGGAGIYYHFDYVGSPRNYKWINVTPLPKVWEQMHLAWKHDATRMWVVNVGDLKPMEVPIEFFLHYAWNPAAWPADRLAEYLRLWATREFGPEHAADIADIVAKYAKYNGRRKPEQLEPTTFSLVNYREAERVVADWNAIAARAEKIHAALPARSRDAFYQLVLYPARAAAVVNEMLVAAGQNRLYSLQGRASTNERAARVRELFALDAELVRRFHEDIAGGKWNRMMSQAHLGYTSWNQPPRNTMPAVTEVQVPHAGEMGVAVEGSEVGWPGRGNRLTLPPLDRFEQQPRWLEIFNRGATAFQYAIEASEPWVTVSAAAGTVAGDVRVWIDARWPDVPRGAENATLTVSGPDNRKVTVVVPIRNPADAGSVAGFVETRGIVAIEAEHYAKAVAPSQRQWLRVPDHGRTLSGMTTLPADAAPAALADGMRLEYPVHLFSPGKVKLLTTLAPTQKLQAGPGLRFAVSFDDEAPRIVNLHADESKEYWGRSVSDGAVTFTTEHALDRSGAHTLKFWALDAGVVLQRLVIDAGGLVPSYLGPPESPRLP